MTLALLDILKSFEYPVYRQGSMSDKKVYPETFLTFWCNDTPDHAHYDNAEYLTDYDFNVYVYSSKPSKVYELIAAVRAKLKESGWSVPSKGFDAMSDEKTHIGRGLNCLYLGK